MTNPVVDLIGDRTGRIVPVYPQSEKAGLTTWEIAGWVERRSRAAALGGSPTPPDGRAASAAAREPRSAFRAIHQPESMDAQRIARRRLVFDELLRMQLALVLRKRALEQEAVGIRHVVRRRSSSPVSIERLPSR